MKSCQFDHLSITALCLIVTPLVFMSPAFAYHPEGKNAKVGAATEHHIEELNRFAETAFTEELQKEADQDFKRLGVAPESVRPLSSVYSISVGRGGECFYESHSRAGRLVDTDLKSEANVAQVKKQIQSAAKFAKEIRVTTRGQKFGPYQLSRIEICSAKILGGKLLIEPNCLLIGTSWGIAGLKAHSSIDLMKYWNSGEGLTDADEQVKRLWIALNPVGFVRKTLRSLLERIAYSRAREIQAHLTNPVTAATLIRSAVDSEAVRTNTCVNPTEWASSLNQKDMKRLLVAWRDRLLDPALQESLIETASVILEQAVPTDESQPKVRMYGLLNVGNYHRIEVTAPISIARNQIYVKAKQVARENIDATVVGLINIYTVDDIRVSTGLQLSLDGALESASFEEAYYQIAKRPSCL